MKDQLYEISGKFLGGRKEKEHSYVPERTDGVMCRSAISWFFLVGTLKYCRV